MTRWLLLEDKSSSIAMTLRGFFFCGLVEGFQISLDRQLRG